MRAQRYAWLVLLAGCTHETIATTAPFAPEPLPPDAGSLAPDASTSIPIPVDCEPEARDVVQETYLALLGRPPNLRELRAELARVEVQPELARADLVRRAYAEPEARAHLSALVLDWLEVPRVHDRERPSMQPCYGSGYGQGHSAELASFVRDRSPEDGKAPAAFTLRELLLSSLVLDDPTPFLRAHLIAQQHYPLWPANAGPDERERLRRRDFGARFLRVYLNRDLACLTCHNGEASVTWTGDPATNRHHPLATRLERLLFEAPSGAPPQRVFAPFRYEGFAAAAGSSSSLLPWGWDGAACGAFQKSAPDVLQDDALLATIRGTGTSVLDVEASLRQGLEALRGRAVEAGVLDEPNQAFAYLVAATFVEHVARELLGARLTEAHHFSVTADQRALLAALTQRFIADRYSLRELLVHIIDSPHFLYRGGRACNEQPIARIHRTGRDDVASNVVLDALRPRSARVVLASLHGALGWPPLAPESFPSTEADIALLRSLGTFMRHGEPGFRGFDMQALLALEERYGGCRNEAVPSDRVSALVAAAIARGASVSTALQALEQLMTGSIELRSEPLANALDNTSLVALDEPVSTSNATAVEASLRTACGVLQLSPRMLTYGLTAPASELPPEVAALLDGL